MEQGSGGKVAEVEGKLWKWQCEAEAMAILRTCTD